MTEYPVTPGRMLRIWWAVAWRASVGGAVAGFFAGAAAGVIVTAWQHPEWSMAAGAIGGYIVSIPISMWALHAGISKRYQEFRIVLVPLTDVANTF